MKDDVNKRLCELLDAEPYETYNHLTGMFIENYPDFASSAGRIDLLQRLKEKGCVYEFLARFAFPADFVSFLLDDNGALARVALEFLEGKKCQEISLE